MLGELPELWGAESIVMDAYVSLRNATHPDRGVDPLAFLTLYERMVGPSETDWVVATLSALEAEHQGFVSRRRESEIETKKRQERHGERDLRPGRMGR